MSSRVLDEFEVPENVSGNFKAKCKHCESYISGSTKATNSYTLCTTIMHALFLVIFVNKTEVIEMYLITFIKVIESN